MLVQNKVSAFFQEANIRLLWIKEISLNVNVGKMFLFPAWMRNNFAYKEKYAISIYDKTDFHILWSLKIIYISSAKFIFPSWTITTLKEICFLKKIKIRAWFSIWGWQLSKQPCCLIWHKDCMMMSHFKDDHSKSQQ